MITLTVFPTSVGVFLKASATTLAGAGLPHVRGGVSIARTGPEGVFLSSPRPWGCFCERAP